MKKNNSGQNVSEKKLFHGTDPAHVDAICHNNFDWRICGTHGTAYGNGEMKQMSLSGHVCIKRCGYIEVLPSKPNFSLFV